MDRYPTDREQAKFHSIVVHSSGAAEIYMTGRRDVDRQDWELENIFRTRTATPDNLGAVALRDEILSDS